MTSHVDFRLSNASLGNTVTTPRATDPTAGDRFRSMLATSATTAIAGLERALPFVPGGVSTTTAIRALDGGPTAPTASSLSSGGSSELSSLTGSSSGQAFELLAMQQAIGMEQQWFSTASNVMKARHDTAKNLIGNVR